jgi:murein DD-endopeptidase MepM/ murein hydrolase activator NlpD
LNNYVDLDPSEGGFQDWNWGGYSYDGHRGIDALIGTFEHQFIGVPIFAALDGIVYSTHDGEPDQNTVWNPDTTSNYVGIDHGEGRYANYLHMKQGSVLVEVGQEVKAGEQIGFVASSGYSNWPHLHFESWNYDCDTVEECVDVEDWAVFEPYSGDCNPGNSGWENQVDIPEFTKCRDFGVTTANLADFYANEEYMWTPPLEGYIPLDHDAVWMWMQATKITPFSTFQMRFYDPNGVLQHDSGTNWLNFTPFSYRFMVTWFSFDIPELHTISGTWTVNFTVNGSSFLSFPMTMVSPFVIGLRQSPVTITPIFTMAVLMFIS